MTSNLGQVNPYPVKDGEIEWLAGGDGGSSENIRYRDRDAEDEAERKTNLLLKCDGYINLCNIKKVRKVHRGASAADENMDEGSDVDFDLDVDDSMEDDGITHEFDDERTFELVLRNGLIIRLQVSVCQPSVMLDLLTSTGFRQNDEEGMDAPSPQACQVLEVSHSNRHSTLQNDPEIQPGTSQNRRGG